MPHSLKNHGASIERTEPSQKKANPPHIKLNGTISASIGLSKRPWAGRPIHLKTTFEPVAFLSPVSGYARSRILSRTTRRVRSCHLTNLDQLWVFVGIVEFEKRAAQRFGDVTRDHPDWAFFLGVAACEAVPVRAGAGRIEGREVLREQRCDDAAQHVARTSGGERARSCDVDVRRRSVVDQRRAAFEQRRDAGACDEGA